MVFAKEEEETLVYGIKLSSVGPGKVTGQNTIHEPTNLDLATKLHYLRGVYYFKSTAVQGLTVTNVKEPMFYLLNHFATTCGRFRRSESGRPYIKCNDCGVRIIEAQCTKTLDEWLEKVAEEESGSSTSAAFSFLHKLLFPNQIIGPEIFFSPLIYLQLTWFKCGGISMGLSWAHVLGDAFSAAGFMNALGQHIASNQPSRPIKQAQSHSMTKTPRSPPTPSKDPLSVKRVDPVGDNWITSNNLKMETFSFHLTTKQIIQLQSKVCGQIGNDQIPVFECLCGVIWKIIAHIRDGSEPKLVTICKNDPHGLKNGVLSNGQVISLAKADFSIIAANPMELAKLVINQAVDERSKIEEAVERDQGVSDFITYGANLTFVDLEEVDFYGLQLKGHKSTYVSYTIDGVGDKGVVLVLQGPKEGKEGKVVTLIMPKNEISELKSELKRAFSIA